MRDKAKYILNISACKSMICKVFAMCLALAPPVSTSSMTKFAVILSPFVDIDILRTSTEF